VNTINVETTATRCIVTDQKEGKGVAYHTNHYVSELKSAENISRQSPTTKKRYADLQKYFSTQPQDLSIAQITTDIFAGKKVSAVCIQKPAEANAAMTCGGIILDMKKRQGQSYAGLYTENDRRSFSW